MYKQKKKQCNLFTHILQKVRKFKILIIMAKDTVTYPNISMS